MVLTCRHRHQQQQLSAPLTSPAHARECAARHVQINPLGPPGDSRFRVVRLCALVATTTTEQRN
jgi:hypothetical protein